MTSDWPQQIIKPHMYGNFRPSRAERAKKHVTAQKRREGNSEKHLAAIRRSPCLCCGRMDGNDPHHLRTGPARSERGIGMKCTDRYTIPVCRKHHEAIEKTGTRGERDLLKSWGFSDVDELCAALWDAPCDPAIYTRIILAHRRAP